MNPNGVKLKNTELNNTELKKATFYKTGICKKKHVYIRRHLCQVLKARNMADGLCRRTPVRKASNILMHGKHQIALREAERGTVSGDSHMACLD